MKSNLSERQKRAISSLFAVIIVVTLPATSLAGIQPVRAEHQNPESDLLDYTQTSLGPHVNIPNNHEITIDQLPENNLAAIYESQDIDADEKTVIMRYTLEITECQSNTWFTSGITDVETPSDGTDISGIRVACTAGGPVLSVWNEWNNFNFDSQAQKIQDINLDQEYDIEIRYNYGNASMTIEVDDNPTTVQYPAARHVNIAPFVNKNLAGSSVISGNITDYSLNLIDIKNIGQDFNTFTDVNGQSDVFNWTNNWVSAAGIQPDDEYELYKEDVGANQDRYKIEYEIFISGSSGSGYLRVGAGEDELGNLVGSRWNTPNDGIIFDNAHFSNQGTQSVDGGVSRKLYITEYLNANNATHVIEIYNDSDKQDLAFSGKDIYPAGEQLPDLWAMKAVQSGQNVPLVFNIGNLEVSRAEVPNVNGNLSEWTLNDADNRADVSKNIVSYRQLDTNQANYLVNNSGPGTDTARLNFTLYADSASSGQHSIGFSTSGTGGLSPGQFLGIRYYAAEGNIDMNINGPSGIAFMDNASMGEFWYVTFIKGETDFKVSIYSDPERTNLVAEETAPYDNTTDYTHTYAYTTRTDANFGDLSGLVLMGNNTEDVNFVIPYSGNITLDVNPWMDHGDTQEYKVLADNGTNIASQSTVTSGNTTVITINSGPQELEATSDESINDKVLITAEFGDATDTENVTVANRTIGNIGILPPSQRPGAVIGIDDDQASYGIGSEIQWILLAVFIGAVGAWKARNEWIGVGVITGALILFWTVGHVSLGYTIVGVFYAIFTGYQLVRTPSRSDTKVGAGIDNFP